MLVPHLRAPSPALWRDAAIAGMLTHNDPASIGACIAFVDLLWKLIGRTHLPERGWWLDTFVATMRDVEGDVARYRPRTPHVAGVWPVWRFTATHVGAALERDVATVVLRQPPGQRADMAQLLATT